MGSPISKRQLTAASVEAVTRQLHSIGDAASNDVRQFAWLAKAPLEEDVTSGDIPADVTAVSGAALSPRASSPPLRPVDGQVRAERGRSGATRETTGAAPWPRPEPILKADLVHPLPHHVGRRPAAGSERTRET
jgi:hypothetical protein